MIGHEVPLPSHLCIDALGNDLPRGLGECCTTTFDSYDEALRPPSSSRSPGEKQFIKLVT
jgi:hypothetical protein